MVTAINDARGGSLLGAALISLLDEDGAARELAVAASFTAWAAARLARGLFVGMAQGGGR